MPNTEHTQSEAASNQPRICGLAISSMVLGLLSLLFITWTICGIPAIILGIIAINKINKSNGRLKGTGFAVTGIVTPIMLPILMVLLMPALIRDTNIVQRVKCNVKIKSLSNAICVYADTHNNQFPTPERWCDLIMEDPGELIEDAFRCPLDPKGTFSYAINKNISITDPGKITGDMVLLFEADLGKNAAGGPEDLVRRHDDGCNIAFADGHVEFVTEDRIADLQWTAE